MVQNDLEYQLTQKDLERCFKFALEYHLDKTKLATNRTTGQYRGFGGIIDSFVIGKLIEIGVAELIEGKTKKKCALDFDIHQLKKENISDPDIIKIIDKNTEREPNLYVEIKNISEADRWIGLTAEQFSTILSDKLVNWDPKKVVLIYASLIKKNESADIDPLGVYLKSKLDSESFEKFCNVKDLYVKIQYIITGDDLKKFGVAFNQGSYLYETEIIKEASPLTAKRILNSHEGYEKIKLKKGKLPIIMSNLMKEPEEFGEFTYKGDIEVYMKTNYKRNKISSRRMYIYCKKTTIIKNKVLGTFNLEKDKIYECWFTTVGMNPSLKRNNIWIAQRNLKNIVKNSLRDYIKDIQRKI
ncbi:MAG: hypothetical protein WC356_04370 [Candidatus Micrarchaeia archaeon]|jgi:hypothetical protein